MPETPVQPDRIPIFSKRTNKLLFRISEEGVHGWCKINKEWELVTWEELRAELEVHKGKQSVTI
jgi:hypothetical protein